MKATLAIIVSLGLAGTAFAWPVQVESIDGPQDPLLAEGDFHELGEGDPATGIVFPEDEWITVNFEEITDLTSCFEPDSDSPNELNWLVSITNMTSTYWQDVHYVADPETRITNHDGWIGNAGMGDHELAFRIDWVGINRPLIFESMAADTIFAPGETWHFILQDFGNMFGGPAGALDSIGLASLSSGWPLSTGSIIAREVPGPATLSVLALFGAAGRRRRS